MNKKIGIISLIVIIGVLATYLVLRDHGKNEREGQLTIPHELGEAVLDPNPERVIVFDFGIADALHHLGIEIIGLPKASLPTYLDDIYGSNKYSNVGSLKEPDFEQIAKLKPDLIIISSRQRDLYENFDKIAPTLYMALDTSDYLGSFDKNLNILGKIFEKEEEVKALLDEVKQAVNSLQQALYEVKENLDRVPNALILMVNGDKISAYGEGSRFGIIHKEFGFEAIAKDLVDSTHGANISFERVLELNPDYLFVIDRGLAIGENTNKTTREIIENEIIKETNAYKNGNIIYLDSEVWYLSTGGIYSTKKMIEEVKQALIAK